MTCAERKDDLLLYALEALEGPERTALSEHLLSGCPECAGGLAEARAVVGHIGFAAEPVAPPPSVKARLMEAVAAERKPIAFPTEKRRAAPGWTRSLVSAALAAAATAAVILVPVQRERGSVGRELAAQAGRIRELEATAQSATQMIRLLRSPRVEVVSLEGQGSQPDAAARIFWDRQRGVWQLFASNLAPAGAGKTYELWFITADQRKVRAGIFDVDAEGESALEVRVPADLGTIALAAVTDEPAGGTDQPTGSIHLLGKLSPASS